MWTTISCRHHVFRGAGGHGQRRRPVVGHLPDGLRGAARTRPRRRAAGAGPRPAAPAAVAVSSAGSAAAPATARATAARDSAAEVVSQAPPAGQPPTLGGRNGSCPMPCRPASSRRCCRAGSAAGVDPERAQQPDRPLHRLLDQRGRRIPEGRLGGHRGQRGPDVAARPPGLQQGCHGRPRPAGWPRPAGTTAARSRTGARPGVASTWLDERRARRSSRSRPRMVFGRSSCRAGTSGGQRRCRGPPASRTAPGRPAARRPRCSCRGRARTAP